MDTATVETDADLIAKCELGMTKPAPRTTLRRIAEGRMTLIVKGNDIYLDKQNGIPVRHTKNDRIGRTGSIMGLAASWPFVPLGFIDQDGHLTQKGRDFIDRMDREDALNDVAPVISPVSLNSKALDAQENPVQANDDMIEALHIASEGFASLVTTLFQVQAAIRNISAITPNSKTKMETASGIIADARRLVALAQNKVEVGIEELGA